VGGVLLTLGEMMVYTLNSNFKEVRYMAKLTPVEAAEKLATRLKGATTDMRKGVDRVAENPMEKAAAKEDKMKAKILEAIDTGKWAGNLRKVTLEEWKKAMRDKGIPRVAAGIDAAVPKMTAFFEQLFPYQDSLKARIKGMPDLTIEDSVARVSEWVREMGKFKKK